MSEHGAVHADHVTIVMATFNGAEHLQAQLDSFAQQTHPNWSLRVGDDGSHDGTRDLISRFGATGHNVVISEGPRQGSAANFMTLLRNMPAEGVGPWLAFSDQDDIWLPDKLTLALDALQAVPIATPALYCSRTWVTDATLEGRTLSPPRPRPLGFRNALVQNVAAGNTIVLNPAAAQLVIAQSQVTNEVVMHDWWIYQLISGAGGQLIHDDTPTLLYRQHAGNVIGVNTGLRARLYRIGMLLTGRFQAWTDTNMRALEASSSLLTQDNRALLGDLCQLRQMGVVARLRAYRRLGLYRQTAISTLALWLTVLLGRL